MEFETSLEPLRRKCRSYSESDVSSRRTNSLDSGVYNVALTYSGSGRFYSNSNRNTLVTPLLSAKRSKFIKTKDDVIILVSMGLVTYVGLCAFSMIAPFFPSEAMVKGVGETMTGFIFAVYPLTIFLVSPIIGKFLPTVGPKFVLVTGCFLEGSSQILFSFVADLKPGLTFVVFCFIIRIVTAVGTASTTIAYITILGIIFKDHVSTVFGMLELFTGLGLMTGPALGSLLYKYGKFRLPFLTMGCIVLFTIFALVWFLPADNKLRAEIEESDQEETTGNFFATLLIPGVFVVAFAPVTAGVLISFLEPTLTNHVSDIDPGVSLVLSSFLFLISPGLYSIIAPAIGYLIDKKITPRNALCVGLFICTIGYQFVGPSPIWNIKGKLYITACGLVVNGIGLAFLFVPCLADLKISAVLISLIPFSERGLPDNLATQGIISGIFNSAFSIGNVIGSSLGGVLTEYLTFSTASMIISFLTLIQGILMVLFTFCANKRKRQIILPVE